jgi:beta-phosphoglucomutase-like phosphatase (HAD superfamily)
MGAQSGAAVGALSSADLQRLQSQGTAEQVYASALPRLAQLAGEQERRGFLEQMSQDLTDKIAEQEQQSHAEQLDQMWKQREWQRTMKKDKIERSRYRAKTRSDAQANRAAAARAAQALRLAQQQTAYETGQDYISNTQAQQRIDLAVRSQNESEREFQAREARMNRQFQIRMAAAAKTGGKPNASLSAKYGYIVDSNGRPILGKNGKRIPITSDKSSAPWAK